MITSPTTSRNLLLGTLPADALRQAEVEVQEHPIRTLLLSASESPAYVFFPHAGAAASIVRTTDSGQMVEAGVVGGEGLLNVHTLLGNTGPTGTDVIVQGDGVFSRMPAAKLGPLLDDHRAFRQAALGYASVFLHQVTQNVVCNRLHSIEQRLAKWLLVMRDRVLRDDLHLTQEFLSYMLGVHRSGVSIAVHSLETDGLISHRRNWIELRDVAGVVKRSCECYGPLHDRLTKFSAEIR